MSGSTCVLPLLFSGSPRIVLTLKLGQAIHIAMRSSLAHIRQSRIAPSAITAPPPNFVPPSLGVASPDANGGYDEGSRGLQEERVEREAWRQILDALTRLKEARAREMAEAAQEASTAMQS